MSATARLAAPAFGAAAVIFVAACAASGPPRSGPSTSATAPAMLNTLSATDIVGTMHSAGLPTPNPIDVTADKCDKLGCVGEVDSDTVSILKFDHSGAAQRCAGTISNSYLIEDIVLIFAPTVSANQKQAYERVVQLAVA